MRINTTFSESKKILETHSSANEQFSSAIEKHWLERPDHPGEVLASSYCWLYCWCTTSGTSKENAVEGARMAFGKVCGPLTDFEQLGDTDQQRFREFAKVCRNRTGDYEPELQAALKELFHTK